MKLFGHPVHPLLIHFPTALLPMDLGLTILHYTTGNFTYYQAGAYCLWTGALLGLLAVIAGIIDMTAIPRTNKKAITLALYHGFLNGLLLLIFAIIAWKSWQAFPTPFLAGKVGVVVKGILVIALFAGNYMGGKLIYRHHVGINLNEE
ncbi:DUF2231 domain-containing protein [Chitinophaga filiformis]|uniref:Uncharacterized membrane protein n=1 Tax=Chitinophaga filiformis TaxID=104663 RepID=A0A1G7MD17_CHIFI|nr:DUF2231 domain-containing protein [Chitinophaga filiformis]SDF59546.1 Uncharacterized membrane protein [Chitinophaga filiformis]